MGPGLGGWVMLAPGACYFEFDLAREIKAVGKLALEGSCDDIAVHIQTYRARARRTHTLPSQEVER